MLSIPDGQQQGPLGDRLQLDRQPPHSNDFTALVKICGRIVLQFRTNKNIAIGKDWPERP